MDLTFILIEFFEVCVICRVYYIFLMILVIIYKFLSYLSRNRADVQYFESSWSLAFGGYLKCQ